MVRYVRVLYPSVQDGRLPSHHGTAPFQLLFAASLTETFIQKDVVYYWSKPHPVGARPVVDADVRGKGFDWATVKTL